MEQRVTIIGLGVNDLQASTKFYTETFGWTMSENSTDDITFIQLNGILLSLYPREKLAKDATVTPEGSGFRGVTLAHNARSKKEVDQIFSDLKNKGVRIVKPPEEVFWGGYSGYIADPDGHLWEIAYNPYLTLDEDGNVK
ncbi:MAG: VOC family protein [Bacteroidia bacterium]|nr:VOC family protein [Bacteroidia bacterium]